MENMIKLEKNYNSNLTIRYMAETLFDNIDKNKTSVIIDFKNIKFIGKSLAQKYVYQKKNKIKFKSY
ncbi:hypothetical protein [Methanobrevibacter sp. UBA337]|jgi:sporulation protein YlmC with PRC-barrel domain|uniref:hypothetical protein n=1 Tax=Methanobrevibacter sp. UBA337 TaxID=1915480 RepID=UPI0039B92B48